jgi:hypothetical protein
VLLVVYAHASLWLLLAAVVIAAALIVGGVLTARAVFARLAQELPGQKVVSASIITATLDMCRRRPTSSR